ncbi:hypothetical protein GE09DRAFT_1114848 [Coniochaeta sp. 2T2.1]|nr:hypothetical protein GE09DRAFT_1114848 [Coniochaeta sp. 2T2.1]
MPCHTTVSCSLHLQITALVNPQISPVLHDHSIGSVGTWYSHRRVLRLRIVSDRSGGPVLHPDCFSQLVKPLVSGDIVFEVLFPLGSCLFEICFALHMVWRHTWHGMAIATGPYLVGSSQVQTCHHHSSLSRQGAGRAESHCCPPLSSLVFLAACLGMMALLHLSTASLVFVNRYSVEVGREPGRVESNPP